MPRDPLNVSELRMIVHSGTHVDAPLHVIADGPGFDEIPLERLHGPGMMIDIPSEPQRAIEVIDLGEAAGNIRPGDIVCLRSDWMRHADSPAYGDHPYLTLSAARFLADRQIRLLAIDWPSPDLPIPLRSPGFDWPIHRLLLGEGILIAENLRIEAALEAGPMDFIFAALSLVGADGAPARVLARPSEASQRHPS